MKKQKQKKDYFIERNISSDAFISKLTDETAVSTIKDFKYVLSKLAKNKSFLTIQDLLRFCDVLLVYKGTAYVSEFLVVPDGVIESKSFKKVLTKHLKDDHAIMKFLKKGLIVLDVNEFRVEYIMGYNPEQNFFIFTDYKSYFPPVNEIAFLDEKCNIPDEIFIEFFGEESYLNQQEEEYFELEEEYEYLYE